MINWPRYEGQKAINVLRVAAAGKSGETVTIGADVYELATRDDLAVTAGRIAVDVHGGSTVKAQAKLTFTGQPSDGETITVNGKVYTLQTTLTNVDGHVLISAVNAEGTIDNLVAAINNGAGAGTAYAALTSKHTTATAAKSSTDKVILTAIAGGTIGNAYTLAEAATNVAKDAATFGTQTLGVDPTADEVSDALITAINADPAPNTTKERVEASEIGDNEVLLRAKAIGVVTIACTETLTGSNNGWAAAAMYGGIGTKHKRTAHAKRVPNATEVALGNLHFELPFEPSSILAFVAPTSTPGAWKIYAGAYTIDGGHVTLDNGGGVDWAATDTVEVLFIE